jgi:hypothetical protein
VVVTVVTSDRSLDRRDVRMPDVRIAGTSDRS